jgi:6-phosphogluconolactonase
MQFFQPKIIDFEDKTQLYSTVVEHIFSLISYTIGQEGSVRLAFSGGQTPFPVYEKLGRDSGLDWEGVEIYQTDERFSQNPVELNQIAIAEALGQDTVGRLKSFNMMKVNQTIQDAVRTYTETLDSLDSPLFDLTVLGVGTDGHIASLFPNNSYLKHTDELVLPTLAPAEFVSPERVSLSLESVLNTKEIIVLLVGSKKKGVLEEMLGGKKSATEFPAKFLLLHPNVVIFQCLED